MRQRAGQPRDRAIDGRRSARAAPQGFLALLPRRARAGLATRCSWRGVHCRGSAPSDEQRNPASRSLGGTHLWGKALLLVGTRRDRENAEDTLAGERTADARTGLGERGFDACHFGRKSGASNRRRTLALVRDRSLRPASHEWHPIRLVFGASDRIAAFSEALGCLHQALEIRLRVARQLRGLDPPERGSFKGDCRRSVRVRRPAYRVPSAPMDPT